MCFSVFLSHLITYIFLHIFFIFLLFIVLPIYLLLLCPRGYPIWQKAFESSHKTSLSTLTWPFRGCFSIPAFSGFSFLPRATFFFLTHPDQSVPCSDYSTLQIGYTNFFQTAFSSSFFIPTPRGFLRNFFCKCPVWALGPFWALGPLWPRAHFGPWAHFEPWGPLTPGAHL